MFNRREFLEKTVAVLGTYQAAGKVKVIEAGDRPPLLVNFVVDPDLGLDVFVDYASLRKVWRDAFDGNPPCPLIVTVGGEFKAVYNPCEKQEA